MIGKKAKNTTTKPITKTNNMKTAMQELVQIIDIKSMVHNDKEVLIILSNLKAHTIDLLKKEKEQMLNEWKKGFEDAKYIYNQKHNL